jgi:CxxC-x17-CxxC domain-containing protein
VYSDETLTRIDCGSTFTFTASQQGFFASEGFSNKPSRCDDSGAARKSAEGGESSPRLRSPHELFKATCSQRRGAAEVPFQPREGNPFCCRDCFSPSQPYR